MKSATHIILFILLVVVVSLGLQKYSEEPECIKPTFIEDPTAKYIIKSIEGTSFNVKELRTVGRHMYFKDMDNNLYSINKDHIVFMKENVKEPIKGKTK